MQLSIKERKGEEQRKQTMYGHRKSEEAKAINGTFRPIFGPMLTIRLD